VLLTVTTVSGLEASCEALVTVVDDAPPELTVPGDATLACDDSTDPANTGTATATDNCPAAAVVTFSDSTAGTPEETVITRTWTATDGAGNTATADQLITVICDDGGGGAGDPEFLRGDADASGEMRIRDAFKLIRFLYRGREIPCEDAADVNDDGTLNYGDVIYLFRSIFFRRRPPPPAPGPFECGVDPTPDELSCESFPPCD
jgi:hypothetical protein